MNKKTKYEPTVGIESTNPKDMPNDHAEIPVWNAENWFYEDVIIEHKIRSLRRTISEGEAMQFNMMVVDMHPYVADEHFATKEGLFNKRLVLYAISLQSKLLIKNPFISSSIISLIPVVLNPITGVPHAIDSLAT